MTKCEILQPYLVGVLAGLCVGSLIIYYPINKTPKQLGHFTMRQAAESNYNRGYSIGQSNGYHEAFHDRYAYLQPFVVPDGATLSNCNFTLVTLVTNIINYHLGISIRGTNILVFGAHIKMGEGFGIDVMGSGSNVTVAHGLFEGR